jgi:Cupredoxin-like domain
MPGEALPWGPLRVHDTSKMTMTAAWNMQNRDRVAGQSSASIAGVFRHQSKTRLRILIWLKIAEGWHMSVPMITLKNLSFAAICIVATLQACSAIAQDATEVQVTYSNGQFQPNEVNAPADRPVLFRVKNLDVKAMEFESRTLRVEKVVAANSDGIINVRALKPGRYEFYDDFNEQARGALTVQ